MLDKNEYINEVWKQYENCLENNEKRNLYKKNVYRNVKYTIMFKSVLMILISIFSTFGIAYAGVTTYNSIVQRNDQNSFSDVDFDYKNDMIHQYIENVGDIYYKKIMSYEEYVNYKRIWNNIIEMNEEDFKENFVLVTGTHSLNLVGLYIYNISSDGNTMYVTLKEKDNIEEEENQNLVISAKISLELNSDNVIFDKYVFKPDLGYVPIDELPSNYTKEQAIKDNCCVIYNSEIISNDKNQLNDFLEKAKNNIETSIRIIIYYPNEITRAIDIEYTNSKYIAYAKFIKHADDFIGRDAYSIIAKEIKTYYIKNSQLTEYELSNNTGEKLSVCFIKDS